MQKQLTDKEQLIKNLEKRIANKKKNLLAQKKLHREVEAGMQKKIKLDEMQLAALKK